jgi:DNA polymerase I-like protein with 3'-5' exonuclease and polymerase domains
MSFVTLDFETYYARDYSLTKLTTEEYIRSPQFEVIGVAIKIDDAQPEWFSGDHKEIKKRLDQINWSESALLCHNAMFDGAILSFIFNIIPAYYFDTLCMARAKHGVDVSGSLANLVKMYGLGEKGTEVVDALGKRRQDFTSADLHRYGNYCINDTSLTFALFNTFISDHFPQSELDLIDMTLRMYTQPVLSVNDAMLVERLEEIKNEKSELLAGLQGRLGCGDEEGVRQKLASNPQFAAVLKDLNVHVPMKISPTTGKETYALAKNDEGFIELLEHDDPFIQQLCAVRLGTKSTIEESRIERFIGIGGRNRGRIPIPLKYYGAHTGRWAGTDSVNFQNLPSRDKKKKTLKNSILAPEGHVVINCDSSQIEARVLAWLSGQDDVTKQFANGEDVYSIFATKVYKKPISKADPIERFVGKTCLGAGTRVLTRRGWTPILDIKSIDQLWDGVEWVSHSGVSFMGLKPTISLSGLELTTDHEILTGHTKWETALHVQTHDIAFQSALDLATSSLSDINNTCPPTLVKVGDGNRYVNVSGVGVNPLTHSTTLKQVGQRLAMLALNVRQAINGGGNTSPFCRTTSTGLGYSTDWPLPSRGVTLNRAVYTNTTERGTSKFLKNGDVIEPSSFNTYKHWKDGITRNFKWTVSTLTEITSRAILGLYPQAKTCQTKDESRILKPVFDILNSGSRSRFTVLTERGPIIVHNCVLGLGYGTGAKKLQHTLKTQPPGADLPEDECKRIVDLYRDSNHMITDLWRECDSALQHLASWPSNLKSYAIGKHDVVRVARTGILLPNGLSIRYPDLRLSDKKYIYKSRRGVTSIWGGAMVENIVQALARIIVGEQMLKIKERYRPVLTVHDAAVIVAPKSELNEAVAFITQVMSTPPNWATGLPVACEAKYGESYGDC